MSKQISVKEDKASDGIIIKLKRIAKESGRSFSNLVLYILTKFVTDYEKNQQGENGK